MNFIGKDFKYMQMSGKAERASFSAFPGFDCSSVKQILFVFFFFLSLFFLDLDT